LYMLLQATAAIDETKGFWEGLAQALPDILIALGIITLFLFLSKFIRKLSYKLLLRRLSNPAGATISASFISIIFVMLGLFLALDILGLDKTVSSLLAGAGILGLAIGLALQDTLTSAVAGIVMTTRKAYKIGDYVKSNEYEGTIIEINLRNTTIIQNNGTQVKIPNRNVLNNPLENFSLTGERRIDLKLGVHYKENLEFVEQVIRSAMTSNVSYNTKRPLEVYYTAFGESSIELVVRFWIVKVRQGDYLKSQSDAIVAIRNAFKDNHISIPYPIRTIEMDNSQSGIN
jgi:small conductance mechanosensitive channel